MSLEIRNILFFGLILSFFLTIKTQAQTASIIFKGETQFQVSINFIKQHQNFTNNIKINKLKGDQAYNVKIKFKEDTTFVQTNIYLIDDGLTHIYSVTKEAIQLKKVVPDVTYPTNEQQFLANYISNNNLPIEPLVADTAIIDTTYKVPFASYYKLEDYNGRIGCPFPIKEAEKIELKGLIIAETLEESKLEKVKSIILDMDSACMLIEHIKEIALLFEYEETRLDFTKFTAAYTFDLDNYEKLYPLFNFDNSKDELKDLLLNKK
ncbi:MAG: DUF4476 domain-containing protein [Vicingaceae bacterium]